MLNLDYKPLNKLFETNLSPPRSSVRSDENKGEIILRGKKNKAVLGEPLAFNVINKMKSLGLDIPYELDSMKEKYDFYQVQLGCSFDPDPTCLFEDAKFGMTLYAKDNSNNEVGEPLVLDMFPNKIESEIKYNSNYTITDSLKLKFSEFLGIGTERQTSENIEYIKYEPEIEGHGIKTEEVYWKFKKTNEKNLSGNKDPLYVIVRIPKESKLTGKFFLGGRVRTKEKIDGTFIKNYVFAEDQEFINLEQEIPQF